MRRALLLILIVPALPLVLAPSPAFACSCAMASAAEYLEGSDVVVIGAVDEVLAETGAGHHDQEGVVRLRVDRVLKGDVGPFVEVVNGNCNGAALSAKQQGAFFLDRDGDELRADLCGGSGFIKPQEAIAAAGAGHEPDQSMPPLTESVVIDEDVPAQSAIPGPVLLGFLALAAATLGMVIVLRGR